MAIKWTICYVIVMWAILQGMFNFCMFSIADWTKLIHAELHGFGGFVFGILILAALPLYVATTILVVRNKELPIKPDWSKIPILPKLLKLFTPRPLATETPEPTSSPDEKADDIAESAAPEGPALPDDMPAELRASFMRARNKISRAQISSFDMSHLNVGARPGEQPMPMPVTTPAAGATATPNATPTSTTPTSDEDFPLPMDFDMADDTQSSDGFNISGTAPVFTEINFDDAPATENTPAPTEVKPDTSELIEYLKSKSITPEMDGDIIITPTLAIASHTDADFWIADTDTWFAAGKSRPSPVAAARTAAAARGLRPVLFLGANNIMDLNEHIKEWESNGVTVITTAADLPI